MPLDPLNPGVAAPGINPEFLVTQQKLAAAATKSADETAKLVAALGGDEASEAGIYLRILLACIAGGVGSTSADVQIWATDLTRDYIAKYPIASTSTLPPTPAPAPGNQPPP
jgi:hypothetical protein